DPDNIDFPIPANDDASKSIDLICNVIVKAIQEGLEERKRDKEDEAEKEAAAAKAKIDNGQAEEAGEKESTEQAGGKRPRKAKAEAENVSAEATEAKDGE